MTEHNLFQEVQEDLDRQKLEAFWKKYGFWIVLVAVGIVLSTASSTAYRTWNSRRNQTMTSALLEAARATPDTAKSMDLFQRAAEKYQGKGHDVLALLREGSLAQSKNDKAKALSLFEKVASDAKADPAFRQLGALLSVEIQIDEGAPAELMSRLAPLAAEGAPWRFSAKEAQAYLALRMNDKAKAKEIFTSLAQTPDVPQSLAQRATDILRTLD